MATEYRIFYLSPGQKPPVSGSTGRALSDGGIVWVGEEGTFDSYCEVPLINHTASQEEIDEYEYKITNQDLPE